MKNNKEDQYETLLKKGLYKEALDYSKKYFSNGDYLKSELYLLKNLQGTKELKKEFYKQEEKMKIIKYYEYETFTKENKDLTKILLIKFKNHFENRN